MASSGDTVNPKDFKSLENFSAKASLCKTLIKKNREENRKDMVYFFVVRAIKKNDHRNP